MRTTPATVARRSIRLWAGSPMDRPGPATAAASRRAASSSWTSPGPGMSTVIERPSIIGTARATRDEIGRASAAGPSTSAPRRPRCPGSGRRRRASPAPLAPSLIRATFTRAGRWPPPAPDAPGRSRRARGTPDPRGCRRPRVTPSLACDGGVLDRRPAPNGLLDGRRPVRVLPDPGDRHRAEASIACRRGPR